MSRTLNPDSPSVRFDNSTRDRQPQSRTGPLEFDLSGRMQIQIAYTIELFKDQIVVLWIDADACIGDLELHCTTVLNQTCSNGDLAPIRSELDAIDDHVAQCEARLRELAPLAKSLGVTIGVENHLHRAPSRPGTWRRKSPPSPCVGAKEFE